jgi:hypothetical protein
MTEDRLNLMFLKGIILGIGMACKNYCEARCLLFQDKENCKGCPIRQIAEGEVAKELREIVKDKSPMTPGCADTGA